MVLQYTVFKDTPYKQLLFALGLHFLASDQAYVALRRVRNLDHLVLCMGLWPICNSTRLILSTITSVDELWCNQSQSPIWNSRASWMNVQWCQWPNPWAWKWWNWSLINSICMPWANALSSDEQPKRGRGRDHVSQSILMQVTNLTVVEGDHVNQHLTLMKNLNVIEEGHLSVKILQ